MPINSNKTTLKVETNIGGNIYNDEEVTNIYYNHNLQRSTQREAGSHPMDMKTYGHPDSAPEVEEFQMPEDMKKVINDDLTDKGVANNNGWEDVTPTKPKAKRTTKKTKTKTITEQTNDKI